MYDIFVVSREEMNQQSWTNTKTLYPNAQQINNCKSFKQIAEQSLTKMFWVIWDDLLINQNFNLSLYRATKWDNMYVHVFKNGEHKDGICLFPKNLSVSQREFDNRYFVEKKEIDIIASNPIVEEYDIVFISYNEPNADYNFEKLKERFPRTKRIHGIEGIHQAHIAAAQLADTELFYVVDGDAFIVDDFNFDYAVPRYEKFHVHVWRSKNPFNELIYGYGGVKLLPREKTINMDVMSTDMTTSISNNFKLVDQISNITSFNTDAFSTWKSCFRECVKLSSQIISRQDSIESKERLEIWCKLNEHAPYGGYAYMGALMGKEYGEKNRGNANALKKINDFKWLKNKFDEIQ
jgi:hypothetical protein